MIGEEARAAFLFEVGMRVRTARFGRRLTQKQLAELAGVSRVTLGSVELGRHEAGLTTYLSLALALDVPLSVFFEQHDGLVRLVAANAAVTVAGRGGRTV